MRRTAVAIHGAQLKNQLSKKKGRATRGLILRLACQDLF